MKAHNLENYVSIPSDVAFRVRICSSMNVPYLGGMGPLATLLGGETPPPPPHRIADACENITFPRNTFVIGKKNVLWRTFKRLDQPSAVGVPNPV